MPDLSATWEAALSNLEHRLKDETPLIRDYDAVSELVSVIALTTKSEPRFLVQCRFPDSLSRLTELLLRRIEGETGTPFGDAPDELEHEAHESEALKWKLQEFGEMTGGDQRRVDTAIGALEAHAEECRRLSEIEAEHGEEPEEDESDRYEEEGDEYFDIEALFADL